MTHRRPCSAALRPLFCVFLAVTLGCGSVSAGDDSPAARVADGRHELSIGDSLVLSDGSSLKYAEIFDSRCPRGTHCIWQGEVKIHFIWSQVDQEDRLVVLVLGPENGPSDQDNKTNAGRTTITLVAVEPYPDAASKIRAQDRQAVLEISTAEGSSR